LVVFSCSQLLTMTSLFAEPSAHYQRSSGAAAFALTW
jgi:hypothetical protein